MKLNFKKVFIFVSFVLVVYQAIAQNTPLNGTYTIGANANFPTFKAAIDSLITNGVAGPVFFNIKSGTYNEQISIPDINGASKAATITFEPESGDSTQVILNFNGNSTNNYILQLNGGDYLKFYKLTLLSTTSSYGNVIDIRNKSNYNIFSNCIIQGVAVSNYLSTLSLIYCNGDSMNEFNTFRNNRFINGNYGFNYYGQYSPNLERGTLIENNIFENQYSGAISIYYRDSLIIRNNTVNTNSTNTSFQPISCYYCSNILRIEKNKLYATTNGRYGILLSSCIGTSSKQGLISNNFIDIGGSYGVYGVFLAGSKFQNLYDNNILVSSPSAIYGRALYIDQDVTDCNIVNNILVNTGGGYAYYNASPAINVSDYNDLYTTGPNIAYWGSDNTTLQNLQIASGKDLHSISQDPLFVSNTDFHVREVSLNAAGTPLAEIKDDIDGDRRDSLKPDIGADEFYLPPADAGIYSFESPKTPFPTGNKDVAFKLRNFSADTLKTVILNWTVNNVPQPSINWSGALVSGDTTYVKLGTNLFNMGTAYTIKCWTTLPNGKPDVKNYNDTLRVANLYAALGGRYTIGGTSPDFPTFQAAITALTYGGIVGNVQFKIRNGTYNEQISVPNIVGTSKYAGITFEPESGDSTAVILTFPNTSSNTNYIVQLNGADYIKLNKLTLKSTNYTYGNVIDIRNSSNYNTISNCILQGITVTNNNSYVVNCAYSAKNEFNSFRNNKILNGTHGFYYYGTVNDLAKGVIIENNIFENQYIYGLYLFYLDSLTIRKNTISNLTNTSYTGIFCINCNNQLTIEKNKLTASKGGYGIYLSSCSGTGSRQGLISNNFIQLGGTGNAYGIYSTSSNYQRLYSNSINVTSTSASGGRSLYLNYGSYFDVKNNILANTGAGYTIYNTYSSNLISDYNDLYTTGANLAYQTSNLANLSAWQKTSLLDAHSISINPLFTSATDLHVSETSLYAGTPLTIITDDIDGDTRGILKPDIGADEFWRPQPADAGIYSLVSPKIPFANGNKDVTVSLKSFSADTLKTVTLNWVLNGIRQPAVNWSGKLHLGDTTIVKLGTYHFNAGTAYNIKVWTSLPNGQTDVANSNDTIQVNNFYASLAGIYTIGGTTPDFQSFQAAVTATILGGIVGNVTFKVRNGNYNEQISIPDIGGVSNQAIIAFEPESGDSTAVVLSGYATSTANYTLQLNGADYLKFNRLTILGTNSSFGNVIDIRNSSNHNTFSNCILQAATNASNTGIVNSSGSKDEYNWFKNNKVKNGNYGFFYSGPSSTDLEKGTLIENNIFENQGYQAISIAYEDSLSIRNNTINTNSTQANFYAVDCNYCNNQLIVGKNKLYVPNGGYGVYLVNCTGSDIKKGLISNNFIQVGGTATSYGCVVYLSSFQGVYNNNINITSTAANSAAIYIIDYNGDYRYNDIRNNILANVGGGYALYTTSAHLISYSDYNDLYTTGPKLAYWSGDRATIKDLQLASGKDIHSFSQNPLFISNTDLHVREVWLNAAGTPLTSVTDDIDGDKRNILNPDIGADEFNPLKTDAGIYSLESPKIPFPIGNNDVVVVLKNYGADTLKKVVVNWTVNDDQQVMLNWSGTLASGDTVPVNLGPYLFNVGTAYTIKAWTEEPNKQPDVTNYNDTLRITNLFTGLKGIFTIGGANPDFQNFNAAVAALKQCGIIGNVTFKVRNGTYNEQISIPEIRGTSDHSTITFESETRDSSAVVLSYSANSTNNYTLQLDGADYINFYKLSLMSANSTYGNVVEIRNGSNHNNFSNCLLRGVTNSSSIFYSNGSNDEFNSFKNNRIIDGMYGFSYNGILNTNLERGTVIENNIFENQNAQALTFNFEDSLIIRNNTINTNSTSTYFSAISCNYCNNQLIIEKNRLYAPKGGYGISLINCTGTSSRPGLISNNFIQTGGTNYSYGIYLYYANYQNVYNNNINVTSTSASNGSALYINLSVTNANIINNILANTGGGYALYNSTASNVVTSDHNDLYTSGPKLAYWTIDKATLNDLQLASGNDLHSFSFNPLYVSTTDLHVREIALNKSGSPIAVIADDIDGDLRDASHPDIGADEFILPTQDDAGITAINAPKILFAPGAQNVNVALRNFGIDTLKSVTIRWYINNVPQPPFHWTGSLVSAAIDMVTLGTYSFKAFNAYSIKVWPEYPNNVADTINKNDTAYINNAYPSMNGVYTIGGTSPDFITFSAAAKNLILGGMSGPVIFNARPGNYKEQLYLSEVPGISASNRVMFQSENGDSTSVVLRDSTTSYVVQLDGADYITFNHLTIRNNFSNNGKLIELKNGSNYNQFLNNNLIGVPSTIESPANAVILSLNSSDNHNLIRNNNIVNGSNGVLLQGIDNNNFEVGNIINGNTFKNQTNYALKLVSQDGLLISGNTITEVSSANALFYGCYLNKCSGSFEFSKNKTITNDGYGLYIEDFSGTSANAGLIANNFISVGGSQSSYGIYLENARFLNIFNNNVNITNTNLVTGALYYADGTNASIINNIFSNTGGRGFSLVINGFISTPTSDYNNLFTTGPNLVHLNIDQYRDLASWKSFRKMELHSISVNPLFNSGGDLHVSQKALDNAGTPLPQVTDDIDGDVRSPNFPDIGADEFANAAHDIGVSAIVTTSGCMLSNNEPITVTIQNLGANPESGFNVAYRINNSQPVIETVNQMIPAGGSIQYDFNKKADLSNIRSYSLQAYSILTGDQKPGNDTTKSTISNMARLKVKSCNDTTVCPGSLAVLSATGADYYQWSTGASGSTIGVYPLYTTEYTVIGYNLFNCEATDTVVVEVTPTVEAPSINPSGFVSFCNDSSVVLTASVGQNITWSTGEKTPSITVYNAGYYTVRYTDAYGCSAVSPQVITTEEAVPVIVPHDTTICSFDTISLRVKNAVHFVWSTRATIPSIKVYPLATSTYTVTATSPLGCTFTDKSTVTILPAKKPGQVSGMLPANGATDLSLPLELSWMPGANASSYDLFIWPADQTKPSRPYASNIQSIRYKLGDYEFTYGILYKWQVMAKYYGCESTPGPVQTFMLRNLPDLIVTNVQVPTFAFTGQNIEITWDVKNQGLGSTLHQQWIDQLYMTDTIFNTPGSLGILPNMTSLEPGESYSKKASFTLPKHLDGLFTISAWADRNYNLLETSKGNNQGYSTNPLWVKLTPPPDLYVSSVIAPSDIFSEDTVNVSWTVINKGQWPTETNVWTDRIYISQDYNNAQRYIIGNFKHTSDTLKPGQSYSNTQAVIIPEGIFGKYYIYVETDVNNNVYEHAYDGNNVTQSDSVNVILRPPADLMVNNIVIPHSVTNIESANIRWRVTNIGNSSPADKKWNDAVYLSKSPDYDLSKAYSFVFPRSKPTGIPVELTYNNSEYIKIPNDIDTGDYYVYVKTDADNQVFEYSFEENNILRSDTTMKITNASCPDLVVTAFSHPDSAATSERISISYTVTNKGMAAAKGEWLDQVFISEGFSTFLLTEIKRIGPLSQNASYTISSDVVLPSGLSAGSKNYNISVVTDVKNNVYEQGSELNNRHDDIIFIKPSDLSLGTTNIPAQAYSASVINLEWAVKNIGGACTPAQSWYDEVDLLDSLLVPVGIQKNMFGKSGPLLPGNFYTNKYGLLLPDGISGKYYIRLATDIYNKNNERVTSNNTILVPVNILLRQPSDLVINHYDLPSTGIAGQPVNISWEVKNAGPGATLAKKWEDRIYLSQDSVLGGGAILLGNYIRENGLAPGEAYNVSEDVFLPISATGNYYLIVKTDYPTKTDYGSEYEYNAENNNAVYALITITLPAPCDLIVTNITAPAKATTGEPLTIGWTIKNIGSKKAEGYLTDMVYFSKDSVWDINDPFVGELPGNIKLGPNEQTTFSLTTDLTGMGVGDYYVIVRTDNKNNIYEVNDLNNTLSTSSKVNVEVPLLPLFVLNKTQLVNNKGLYYRIEVPDSLIDKSLLISLKGDSIKGANDLFIKFGDVPDRSNFDLTSVKPFNGNQEIIVSGLKKGTYYLLVYGATESGNQQDISLYAGTINFQVRSLETNEGGNAGTVTVEMDGAKFTSDMKVALKTINNTIVADTLIFVDATKVFVTFNLMDAPLGFCDVVASKPNGDTAFLKNGFKVVTKSPFSLVTSVKYPILLRYSTAASITIQFANDGNLDIPLPKFTLYSLDKLPIAFLKKDLNKGQTELKLEFHELNGPQYVLRPGAINTIYIWVLGSLEGLRRFKFE